MKKKASVLLNYNFKGGVGKTTTTGMEAYILSQNKGKKVLLIDLDPQESLTEMMTTTFGKEADPLKNLFRCLLDGDLKDSIVKMNDTLDLVPSTWKMNDFPNHIANVAEEKRRMILNNLLEPLKEKYDYIFIDVPPTLNDIVQNAIFAADGISIIMQTQKMSYLSAITTVDQLISFKNKDNAKFSILGVVMYLYLKAKVDRETVAEATKKFKGAIYDNTIKYQERVKGFTSYGITKKDYWDIKAIGMYNRLTNEMVERLEK